MAKLDYKLIQIAPHFCEEFQDERPWSEIILGDVTV